MSTWSTVLTTLDTSVVAGTMRGSTWLYPAVEVVHIVGLAVLVGSVAVFDLRVLGFGRAVPVQAAARMLLPWSAMSLFAIVPAGLLLFSAHPHDFASNDVFKLKLGLIAVAGANAALFHVGVFRSVAQWDAQISAPVIAKTQAAVSIALWISVVLCGRLLAYT